MTLLFAVMVGGYTGIKGLITNFGGPSCRAMALGKDETFSPEQTANAAIITGVAVRRGLPPRAATIALATALQESKLLNITHGDLDSLGLFQQRPSQGWGTEAQILDPVHASNAFYDALVKIDGYQTMEITKVAQKVQRSAYPEAYASHEQQGRVLASSLTGNSPGGLGCRLNDVTAAADPTAVVKDLGHELGMSATANGRTVSLTAPSATLAWAAGSWAVARADQQGTVSVTVADRTWTRSRDETSWSWQKSSTPVGANTVVVRVR